MPSPGLNLVLLAPGMGRSVAVGRLGRLPLPCLPTRELLAVRLGRGSLILAEGGIGVAEPSRQC